MVGSLNKIPLTIVGNLLFGALLTPLGTTSIVVVLISGVWYTYAKIQQKLAQQQQDKEQEERDGSPIVLICKI